MRHSCYLSCLALFCVTLSILGSHRTSPIITLNINIHPHPPFCLPTPNPPFICFISLSFVQVWQCVHASHCRLGRSCPVASGAFLYTSSCRCGGCVDSCMCDCETCSCSGKTRCHPGGSAACQATLGCLCPDSSSLSCDGLETCLDGGNRASWAARFTL